MREKRKATLKKMLLDVTYSVEGFGTCAPRKIDFPVTMLCESRIISWTAFLRMQLRSLYNVYMDASSVGFRHILGLILIISNIDWSTKDAPVQDLIESFDPLQPISLVADVYVQRSFICHFQMLCKWWQSSRRTLRIINSRAD